MPKSDNQKLKIFYILDYLEKNSHQDHPVRAAELLNMLQRQHNIVCDRKTVYSDIAALQDYGVDIVSITFSHCFVPHQPLRLFCRHPLWAQKDSYSRTQHRLERPRKHAPHTPTAPDNYRTSRDGKCL